MTTARVMRYAILAVAILAACNLLLWRHCRSRYVSLTRYVSETAAYTALYRPIIDPGDCWIVLLRCVGTNKVYLSTSQSEEPFGLLSQAQVESGLARLAREQPNTQVFLATDPTTPLSELLSLEARARGYGLRSIGLLLYATPEDPSSEEHAFRRLRIGSPLPMREHQVNQVIDELLELETGRVSNPPIDRTP